MKILLKHRSRLWSRMDYMTLVKVLIYMTKGLPESKY